MRRFKAGDVAYYRNCNGNEEGPVTIVAVLPARSFYAYDVAMFGEALEDGGYVYEGELTPFETHAGAGALR
jgi:hypothetical protein